MNKRLLIVVISFVLLSGLTTVYFLTKTQTPSENRKSVSIENSSSKKLREYTDGSGFSFSYPDGVKVQSNESSDKITYADLLLASSNTLGSIVLKVKDTKISSMEMWVKENSKLGSSVKEIKLAGISGRELKTERGLLAAFLDQGVLFTIDLDFQGNEGFWQKVYEIILSSFAFSQEASSTQEGLGPSDSGSAEDVIFEGEEIIE